MRLKDMEFLVLVTLLFLNCITDSADTNEQYNILLSHEKDPITDELWNPIVEGRSTSSTLNEYTPGKHRRTKREILIIEEKLKVATTPTTPRPTFVLPEIRVAETGRDSVVFNPLQLSYTTEEEFWRIITLSYEEICGICGSQKSACSTCWCDPVCVLHGDCCPGYYLQHGYVPPLDPATQGCRKTIFPGFVDRPNQLQKEYFKMITSCNASEALQNINVGANGMNDKTSASMVMENLQESSHKAYDLCSNPDISAHWNFTRPVTDSTTWLIYKNQHCAICNNVSMDTLLPWEVSVHSYSSQLLWESTALLELYQQAFRHPEMMEFEYKPPHEAPYPRRLCENDNRLKSIGVHYTKCNQTGRWRQYSPLAQKACELLYLPIMPFEVYASYKNPFCYYCNNDVSYDMMLRLRPGSIVMPGKIMTNSLSVLLDFDGSDTRKSYDAEEDSETTRCGDGYIYSTVQDSCLETLCAPGKSPGPDLTCSSPPGITSNAFGYTACYLVAGIPSGSVLTFDLLRRLREPISLSKASFVNEMREQSRSESELNDMNMHAESEDAVRTPEASQEAGYVNWQLIQTLQPTSSVITTWSCNKCRWLGYDVDTESLLVQASWGSIDTFDRDLLDDAINQSTGAILDILYNLTDYLDHADWYTGNKNFSIIKYPTCELERLPVIKKYNWYEVDHSLKVSPPSCKDTSFIPDGEMENSFDCTMDASTLVTIPGDILDGEVLQEFAVTAKYLPVNNLLTCQYVEVPSGNYTFDTTSWTVQIRGCNESRISAEEVSISKNSGALLVCASDYKSHCARNSTGGSKPNEEMEDKHQKSLGILSLVCTLVSMVCCFATFLVYSCIPKLRSAAGVNNMVLTFLLFFAHGLVQFGGGIVEAGTNDAGGNETTVDEEQFFDKTERVACICVGVATHFFWLAAVTAMTTATFHMFFALSFPLRYQQYRGRDFVLVRAYIMVDLLLPILMIAGNLIYSTARGRIFGYGAHDICFVNAGIPKIVFYGVPVFVLIVANIAMYLYTVISLRRTPQIGETKVDRRHAALYARLSVSTGIAWIFGFLHEFTGVIFFAYAFILTALMVGLFVFWAYVMNRKVIKMVSERGRELWQAASSSTAQSSSSGYYKSDNVKGPGKASSKETIV